MNTKDELSENNQEIIDVSPEEIHTVTLEEFKKLIDSHTYLISGKTACSDEEKRSDVIDKTVFLWNYKSINQEEPEAYEEYKEEAGRNGDVIFTGARVRGKKHKHDGTNCDDWFETAVCGKWTVAAVSDGAGSKKFSRIGAKEACIAAVKYMKEALEAADEGLMPGLSAPLNDSAFMTSCGFYASVIQDAVIKARDAVFEAYEKRKSNYEYLKLIDRDMDIKDFSSTLLLCMVLPVEVNGKKECFAVACQIGDGMICSVDRDADFDKALRLLGTPDSGSYSGETDFLVSAAMGKKENLMSKTKVMRGSATSVMLMTDGVADDYFPSDPQLLRLVMDLELNGILPLAEAAEVNSEEYSDVPLPVKYPWVNDNEKLIAVQYASKVSETLNQSLGDMWKKYTLINKASLLSFEENLPDETEQRLKRWLDNYAERGSFDDRTLVILNIVSQEMGVS